MNELFSLDGLAVGESAWVTEVRSSPAMRRRLLDIGLIPGTRVACVAKSPAGDPAAYAIRGAVVALRRQDAALVGVEGLAERRPLCRAVLA